MVQFKRTPLLHESASKIPKLFWILNLCLCVFMSIPIELFPEISVRLTRAPNAIFARQVIAPASSPAPAPATAPVSQPVAQPEPVAVAPVSQPVVAPVSNSNPVPVVAPVPDPPSNSKKDSAKVAPVAVPDPSISSTISSLSSATSSPTLISNNTNPNNVFSASSNTFIGETTAATKIAIVGGVFGGLFLFIASVIIIYKIKHNSGQKKMNRRTVEFRRAHNANTKRIPVSRPQQNVVGSPAMEIV